MVVNLQYKNKASLNLQLRRINVEYAAHAFNTNGFLDSTEGAIEDSTGSTVIKASKGLFGEVEAIGTKLVWSAIWLLSTVL